MSPILIYTKPIEYFPCITYYNLAHHMRVICVFQNPLKNFWKCQKIYKDFCQQGFGKFSVYFGQVLQENS